MNVFIKREYDYAIRITAYLAGQLNRQLKSVSEIARKLYISRPFATKIVHRLKNNGIVSTVQGRHGGLYLSRAPQEISLFDVLNAMGFDSTLNECVKNPGICPLVGTCKIHNYFIEQESLLIQSLKSRTISEFSFSDHELKP